MSEPSYSLRSGQIHFTRQKLLSYDKGCELCKEVSAESHTTPCGRRICKQCLDGLFEDAEYVCCPISHDDMDDDCPERLMIKDFSPDRVLKLELSREKCLCPNQEYGCKEQPVLKKLQVHHTSCIFTPIKCSNVGCGEKIAGCNVKVHEEDCQYKKVLLTPERYSEDDSGLCFQCSQCQKKYSSEEEMEAHQKINFKCVTKPGKCFYYESCSFTAKDVEELKRHLQDPSALSIHLEHQTTQNLRRDQPRIVSLNTITKKKLQMVENPSDADEATAPVCDAVQSRDGNLEE